MRIAIAVILLFSCSLLYGQFDSLLHKPYHQKLDAIHHLYASVIDVNPDSARAYTTIDQLRQTAKRGNDAELLLEADLLEALFDYRCLSGTLDKMQQMVQQGRQRGVLHVANRATYVIARAYWDNQRYEEAFRWYASLDSLLQQTTITAFPNKVEYLQLIGRAYFHFGDYQHAIAYFNEATQVPAAGFYENDWKHAMNNMGLAYQALDSLERSDACFEKVFTRNTKDAEVWEGIASGNLGYNQYLRGNFEAAIPLLQRDMAIATKHGDFGLAAGSVIPMADILTRQGHLDQAKAYIDSAYAFIQRSAQPDRLRLLYPVMSKWQAAKGNPLLAAQYLDSAVAASKHYQEKFNALQMLRANQTIMASQREAALHQLHAESQRQINQRNLILGGLALALLFGAFWTYKQRKTNEIKIRDRDLRLLEADRELHDARIQLDEFAHMVSEKNQLLEAHTHAEHTKENQQLIEQLNKQVVLTDDDWNRFSTLFGKVYPGFQHQLKAHYPTLTPAEIRCLAMEKLRFTNKEMAALQGISTNAVMVTKHRIRKKLDFGSHVEMIAFIQSL